MAQPASPEIARDGLVLVTGSNGFLGAKVVEKLLQSGFRNLRCFVRTSGDKSRLTSILSNFPNVDVGIVSGNLADPEDCLCAVRDVEVVINCAAGMRGGWVDMCIDSVISSRNLLAAIANERKVKRIVHVSSFAVYETATLKRNSSLTEETPLESHHAERNDPYSYAKIKQEQLFQQYAKTCNLSLVVLRPGVLFGPGGPQLSARVGLQFGRFTFHLGGSNKIPLTYVDNCAEAIVLAATKPGIDGEAFNIVDDNLPTSRYFLKQYKKAARNSRSIWVPYFLAESASRFLTWYSSYSKGQIPVIMTPHRVASTWKRLRFDNGKAKKVLGWTPRIPMPQALNEHFQFVRGEFSA